MPVQDILAAVCAPIFRHLGVAYKPTQHHATGSRCLRACLLFFSVAQVLESLLAETSHAFESKSRRLGMVGETVLNDINANFHSSAGELQRLIPIQRWVTSQVEIVPHTLWHLPSWTRSSRSCCGGLFN